MDNEVGNMEEQKKRAVEAFEEKNFVLALKLFSTLEDAESRAYENKCIDLLEDCIYYSSRKKALAYLEELRFYKEYSFFVDAYKRKKLNMISKALMILGIGISTIILIWLFITR